MEYYTDLGKPNKVILLVVGAFRGGLRPLRKKNFLKLEKKNMRTKMLPLSLRGGGKALVAMPLKKKFGFPKRSENLTINLLNN